MTLFSSSATIVELLAHKHFAEPNEPSKSPIDMKCRDSGQRGWSATHSQLIPFLLPTGFAR